MERLIPFLFLYISFFTETKCCDPTYRLKFTDSVFGCDDFTNKMLDCSGLALGATKGEDGAETAKLGGIIRTDDEIECAYDIAIDIIKRADPKDEYVYNLRLAFEQTLNDSDAPWRPVLETMGITKCPVPIADFDVADIQINLDCFSSVMSRKYCGEYCIIMSFFNSMNEMVSCHKFEICIVEEDCEDEE